ncbi:MAG: RNase adapter RapZ [Actinomycetota bacterium]
MSGSGARTEIVLITGLSGAGRSETAKALEDLGWFVVDNLPPTLIPAMVQLAERPGGPTRVAIVADVRGGVFFGELSQALEQLRASGTPYRILFLEASDDDLVARYAATRHRHPVAPNAHVLEGVRAERELMETLRGDADLVLDTSGLSPHDLRTRIREAFGRDGAAADLTVSVLSFGYKYGAPRDADLVLDCRFLPNPHWVPDLRPLPGTDARVADYVRSQAAYAGFLERLEGLLGAMLPGFVAEGKSYLTVAVGCTGGRHRSVVVAEDLGAFFRGRGFPATVEHRDVAR